jgi:Flp pilus assembly protein TadD
MTLRTTCLVLCVSIALGCSAKRKPAPNVARVRLAVAAQRLDQRDWSGAIQAVEPLPERADDRVAALTLRGIALREKGLLDEAAADLTDALKLNEDWAPTHAALAGVYNLRRDVERAAVHHGRAVEIEPENARYLNDLAFSLYVRSKPKEALPLYQRALRAAPDDRRIRNNYGFALARTGDFSRAAQQFELGGTAAEAKNNLGYAYEQAGNLPQAFDRYVEALRLDSTLRRAHSNLRHVAQQLQRPIPADVDIGGRS